MNCISVARDSIIRSGYLSGWDGREKRRKFDFSFNWFHSLHSFKLATSKMDKKKLFLFLLAALTGLSQCIKLRHDLWTSWEFCTLTPDRNNFCAANGQFYYFNSHWIYDEQTILAFRIWCSRSKVGKNVKEHSGQTNFKVKSQCWCQRRRRRRRQWQQRRRQWSPQTKNQNRKQTAK